MTKQRPRLGTGGAAGTIELAPNSRPAIPSEPTPTTPQSSVPQRWRDDLAQIRLKLLWDLSDIALLTGLSRRLLERMIASGKFPRADLRCGRRCLYRPRTVRQHLEIEEEGRS
jgi:hypothetical protein